MCQDCDPGTHAANLGFEVCDICELGSSTPFFGQAHCVPCSAGIFNIKNKM